MTRRTALPTKVTEAALNALLLTICLAVKTGEQVDLEGFGTWQLHKRAAYRGIHPRTHEPMLIPAKAVAVFKAGKGFAGEGVPPKTTSKTPQQLSELEQLTVQIAALEQQKKVLEKAEKEKERRAQVSRLIKIGALTLKYFELPKDIDLADCELVLQRIVAVVEARKGSGSPSRLLEGQVEMGGGEYSS